MKTRSTSTRTLNHVDWLFNVTKRKKIKHKHKIKPKNTFHSCAFVYKNSSVVVICANKQRVDASHMQPHTCADAIDVCMCDTSMWPHYANISGAMIFSVCTSRRKWKRVALEILKKRGTKNDSLDALTSRFERLILGPEQHATFPLYTYTNVWLCCLWGSTTSIETKMRRKRKLYLNRNVYYYSNYGFHYCVLGTITGNK